MDIRNQISKLSEDDFREKVIIPMMHALGAIPVEDHHGSREDGRDVYFAYKDIAGDDKHCCIFIKAGDIKKSGKNDVRKMRSQIEEALKRPLLTHQLKKVRIQEFYFASNGLINRDAREYLYDMINGCHMPNYKVYEINKIIQIINEKIIEPFNLKTDHNYRFNIDDFHMICNTFRANILNIYQDPIFLANETSEGKQIK